MLQFVNMWLLSAQKSCWPFLLFAPILLIFGYNSITRRLCHVSLEEQPDLPEKPYEMATCMFTPTSGLSTALRDILTDRPALSKYHNFLRGFQMHNEYIQQEHFTKWKGMDSTPAVGWAQGQAFSKGCLYVLKRTEWVSRLVVSTCWEEGDPSNASHF